MRRLWRLAWPCVYTAWLCSALAGCRDSAPGESDQNPVGVGSSGGSSVVATAERLALPAPPANDYVGGKACAPCHEEIAAQYAQHPMSQSLQLVLNDPVEDYGPAAEFAKGPARRYRVERTAEGVRHHEIGLDNEGKEIFDQALDVRFAIGSGRRGRSYLIDREGLLFMSPISWYSTAQQWDLSPEYRVEDHPRFGRPANDRCLNCHGGRLLYDRAPSSDLAQRYREPIFAELEIGCERCHGPGRAHVERHRDAAPSRTGKDPTIVNPARLPHDRRDAVCNQCHLHGEGIVARYGRANADFRPGDHLGDIWSAFVATTGVDSVDATRAVSHGDQMAASVCFQKSKGKLGCISCHDPHRLPDEENKAAYFNRRCVTCHESQKCSLPSAEQALPPALGSCIACHMPPLQAQDVPHTSQTDHRIPRRPQTSDAQATSGSLDPAKYPIFDIADCPLSPLEEKRARGLLLAFFAEQEGDVELAQQAERLLQDVPTAAPDDAVVLDALAVASALQGRLDRAAQLWRSAVTIDPRMHDPLYSLATLAQSEGNLPTASVYFERLLQVNPWQAKYHLSYSQALDALGRADASIASAEKAIELDPSSPDSFTWLAFLVRRKGNGARADELQRIAQRLKSGKQAQEAAAAQVSGASSDASNNSNELLLDNADRVR
jgi:Flp pilus assembly protein TadD